VEQEELGIHSLDLDIDSGTVGQEEPGTYSLEFDIFEIGYV